MNEEELILLITFSKLASPFDSYPSSELAATTADDLLPVKAGLSGRRKLYCSS